MQSLKSFGAFDSPNSDYDDPYGSPGAFKELITRSNQVFSSKNKGKF